MYIKLFFKAIRRVYTRGYRMAALYQVAGRRQALSQRRVGGKLYLSGGCLPIHPYFVAACHKNYNICLDVKTRLFFAFKLTYLNFLLLPCCLIFLLIGWLDCCLDQWARGGSACSRAIGRGWDGRFPLTTWPPTCVWFPFA